MSAKRTYRLPLTLLITLVLARETFASDLSRSALWRVVETCVAVKKMFDISLPCLQVDLERHGSPGTVIVRPPWSRTHTLVVPTTRLSGIEAAALQKPESTAYWRAAFVARRLVVQAAQGRIRIEDVGLAINSKQKRTQDQLHIHVDCARPEVLAALRQHEAEFSSNWRLLASWGKEPRSFGIKIGSDQIDTLNIFELLTHLPGGRTDLSEVAVAVFSSAPDAPRRSFYVVAVQGRKSKAENLLDHSCSLARVGSGNTARTIAQ